MPTSSRQVSRLKMRCPQGHEFLAHINVGGNNLIFTASSVLTARNTIKHEKPCPVCGRSLSAPAGTYTPDERGVMIRIEDTLKH
jgi:hypothetical protein